MPQPNLSSGSEPDTAASPVLPSLTSATKAFRRPLHAVSEEARTSAQRSRSPFRPDDQQDLEEDMSIPDSEGPPGNIVEKVTEKWLADAKLHPELANSIKQFSLQLGKDINQLQRVGKRLATSQSHVEQLSGGSIPPELPKYKSKSLSAIDVTPYATEDVTFTVTIPANTSCDDAKKLLHIQHLLCNQRIEVAVLERTRAKLREVTKKSTFTDRCVGAAFPYKHAANSLDLDLEEAIPFATASDNDLRERASKVWQDTVSRLAVEKVKEEDANRKASALREKTIGKVMSQKPAEWLKATVKEEIAQALKNKKSNKGKIDPNLQVDYASLYTDRPGSTADASSAFPKNVLSPGEAQGGRTKQPKGKGKEASQGGKAKGKGKSKGKDPAQNSQNKSQKGKGKSKGKQDSKGKGKGGKSGK